MKFRNENRNENAVFTLPRLSPGSARVSGSTLGTIQKQPVVVETTLQYGSFNNVMERMKAAALHQ